MLFNERVADAPVHPTRSVRAALDSERLVDRGFVSRRHALEEFEEIAVRFEKRTQDFFDEFATFHWRRVRLLIEDAVLLNRSTGREFEADVQAVGRVDDGEIF
ncbi:hypothetical protein [Paraburkholderia sp. RCC_158]|uniref:hypothetical protein n=1 Tax=Paraburkholderia sp. RCC_158 TaxID=3239220 RepID=UPI003523E461